LVAWVILKGISFEWLTKTFALGRSFKQAGVTQQKPSCVFLQEALIQLNYIVARYQKLYLC